MSSIKMKFAGYLSLLVLGMLLSEVVSFAVFGVYHLGIRNIKFSEFTQIMKAHYTEIYRSSNDYTLVGSYDPLTQLQYGPNFQVDKFLKTNAFGFVGNESGNLFLEEFPQKRVGTFRVIMLGGSSTFGSGVNKGSRTISAHLEHYSNTKLNLQNSPYEYIQVLNFGHPGANTSIELAKLSQYVAHLDPDLVISFDGFNDAWYALFEPNRMGLDHGIINWADISYRYFECMNSRKKSTLLLNGCQPITNFGFVSIVLPTTSSLAVSVLKKVNKKDWNKILETYPPYRLSKFVLQKDQGLASTFKVNYAAAAGLACVQDFGFLGVLQPHALENPVYLTALEKNKIKEWAKRYAAYTGSVDGYVSKMSQIYNSYEKAILTLNQSFNWCDGSEFVSLRHLFDKQHGGDDYFLDNIHYTEVGNKSIALALLPYVKERVGRATPK